MAHPDEGAADVVTEVQGPLSVDDAAEAISQLDDDIVFGEPADDDGRPIEKEAPPPDDVEPDEDFGDDPEDETSEDEPDDPAIEPPTSWSDEAKAVFSTLPPEAQGIIAERERTRDQAFQTKTQELAEARKRSESEQQAMEAERQYFVQTMQSFAPKLPDPPDRALLSTDPQAYLEQQADYQAALAQRQEIEQRVHQVTQHQQQQEQQKYQAFVREQNENLAQVYPDWNTEQGKSFKQDIAKYAQDFGYGPERLAHADALDIQIIHKAMQFDALQAKKPKAEEALKAKPKVQKPGVKAGKGQAAAERQAVKLKRLRNSGSVEDAASVIFDTLD